MIGVGQVLFAFFEDHLKTQKGLRPGSVRSYRDTMKLFLAYVAASCRRPITRLQLADLSAQRVRDFLNTMEVHARESCEHTQSAACRLAYLLPLPRPPASGNAG